jgi:hypothetical protein
MLGFKLRFEGPLYFDARFQGPLGRPALKAALKGYQRSDA